MQTTTAGHRFSYGYPWRVHRFLGDDHPLGRLDLRTHVLNYSWNRLNADRLTVYGYLLEFDEPALRAAATQTYGISYDGSIDLNADRLTVYGYLLGFDEPALRAAATQTYGISYDGSIDFATRKLLYRAEYADQSDYADNPTPVDAWYANVELGLRFANQWVFTAGVEMLSGDGTSAFQTPLATLHKFNGFADVFAAATPVDGVEDRYLRVYLPIVGTRLTVTLHDFRSDNANRDYGSEIDAELNWRLGSHWLIGVKYADYSAEEFGADTRKGWLSLQADF